MNSCSEVNTRWSAYNPSLNKCSKYDFPFHKACLGNMPKDLHLLSALSAFCHPKHSKARARVPWAAPASLHAAAKPLPLDLCGQVLLGMKPSSPLQKQTGPIQLINLSNKSSFRAEASLKIRSLMNAVETKTHLPNRWLRLLSDACTKCKGWKGIQDRCQRGSEKTHRGGVPGTESWCQMQVWRWEMKDGCFRLKNNMSNCTMVWRFRELGWERRITSCFAILINHWVGQKWAFLPDGIEDQGWVSTQKNGGTSCLRENLQHGSHDPSRSLMISYKWNAQERDSQGIVALSLDTELYPFIRPKFIEHLWCTMLRTSGSKVTDSHSL